MYNMEALLKLYNNNGDLIMPHHIEHSLKVKVPAHRVWEVLGNFGSIEKTSHSVERSPLLEGPTSGIGTKRKCHFYDNKSVIEEITEYNEGHSFSMILSEYSMPMKSIAAQLKVDKIDNSSCKITMSMDFVVKGSVLGWLLGAILLRPVLKRKVLQKELIGIAYFSATNKSIGKEMPSKDELASIII